MWKETVTVNKKSKIYAFNTHYEINDYELGDFKDLEYKLTYHDWVGYSHIPRFFYDESKKILYIPRGVDSYILENWSHQQITAIENKDTTINIGFNLLTKPRDLTQEKAIRYLTGDGEFQSTKFDTQKILIMPPGTGKTYCTISAIQKLHTRTLIIVHNTNLKHQWIDKFIEYTNMTKDNIVDISSSKKLSDYMKTAPDDKSMVFVTSRRLLISYMEKYGMDSLNKVIKKLGVGLKVFDEAHKEYRATFLIDYATNVKRTIYLTATFALSNYQDNSVFQTSYKMVRKLKITPDDNFRHISYISVLFNSHPSDIDVFRVEGKKRGFDRFEYIDYELSKGILENELRDLLDFFKVKNKLDGKILILSSKKSTCDFFKEVINDQLPDIESCSIYTDNKVEDYKHYEAISATPAMLGTGEDIPGLRFMFNTEPGRSLTNTDQFSGRLRPYMGGAKTTYYVEFVDVGFTSITSMYKTRLKLLKTKVKECLELDKTFHR